jgi:hypothetical protein
MKLFLDQTYYEMLDIQPSASPFEIRNAYKRAHQLYHDDSLASYSFFDLDERKEILLILEKAFHTLANETSRCQYDQELIENGILDESMLYREVRKSPIPMFAFNRAEVRRERYAPATPSPAPEDHPVCREILSRDPFSGADLKRIREVMGISLEHVSARTKVRPGLLRSIEEDEFDQLPSRFHLRQYLAFYATCLGLDASAIVDKYMKRIVFDLPEA